MNILVLGVTGTLGYTLWHTFKEDPSYTVWGTLRHVSGLRYMPSHEHTQLLSNIDVLDQDKLIQVFEQTKPDVVINCIGIIKQREEAKDPLAVLPINSLLPHRLAQLCALTHSRLIHISTDCVFSGHKGNYIETDPSDAEDLYGQSKFIGEVSLSPHAVTLRTSIIGHELNSCYSLVDWFLSQKGQVKGYKKAIFSGLPTIEHARIIKDFVIPNKNLSGLYHVAAKPINKYDLLKLIAEIYGKQIHIEPDEQLIIDRSLNAHCFQEQTGYIPPDWPSLIEKMHRSKTMLWGNNNV